MSDSPKVTVTITCEERTRYSITREIPAEDAAEYDRAVEDGEPEEWFQDFAERYLDRDRDWIDADDLEDVEMRRTPIPTPQPVQ